MDTDRDHSEHREQQMKQSRWGFRGMTVRDWLDLLIVPLALAVIGVAFSVQQDARQQRVENQRAEAERELAVQRAQDDAMQAYLDQMSSLLLEKDLRTSDMDSEVRTLARARTLTVLGRLDADRKATVVTFLQEASLIQAGSPVVSLAGADLTHVNLAGVTLNNADLSAADLSAADLRNATFAGTDFTEANLYHANLNDAFMLEANLSYANLGKAELSAYLWKANFSGTPNLAGADLSHANLGKTKDLDPFDLRRVKSLDGTLMPNGQMYKTWLNSDPGREYQKWKSN